jgi:hypothetical protein
MIQKIVKRKVKKMIVINNENYLNIFYKLQDKKYLHNNHIALGVKI